MRRRLAKRRYPPRRATRSLESSALQRPDAEAARGLIAVCILLQIATGASLRSWQQGEAIPACAHPREVAAGGGPAGAWSAVVSCDAAVPDDSALPLRGPARVLFGQRIDLNTADAALLEVLPGLGPSRARTIVAERERGCFGRVRELTRVHGIGPATLERLRPYLRVTPDCPPAAPPSTTRASG